MPGRVVHTLPDATYTFAITDEVLAISGGYDFSTATVVTVAPVDLVVTDESFEVVLGYDFPSDTFVVDNTGDDPGV